MTQITTSTKSNEPRFAGEAMFRVCAPKLAALRAAEHDPFVRSFPAWFRSYNDTLTTLVRTILDSAAALHARLADE